MNAEAVRAWLTTRHDEDEQHADRIHDVDCAMVLDGVFNRSCDCGVPDQIRREIAAKRRRLERHTVYIQSYVSEPDQACCERCSVETPVPWPCPDIIDDAQAYADRDDFPAELRLPS